MLRRLIVGLAVLVALALPVTASADNYYYRDEMRCYYTGDGGYWRSARVYYENGNVVYIAWGYYYDPLTRCW